MRLFSWKCRLLEIKRKIEFLETKINDKCVCFFCKKRVIPEIRPSLKQEEMCEVNFAEMSSTGNQEENWILQKQNYKEKKYL